MEEKAPTPEKLFDVYEYKVIYDDSSRTGIDYLLNGLSYEEAKEIFSRAESTGKTKFEDANKFGYELTCNYGDIKTYTITKEY